MNYASLFQPFDYKSLHLRNRFVMAPMTRAQSPDGIPTDKVVDYYGRRAAADVGFILSEGTVIERPSSKNLKDIPNFYGNSLAAWKQVVDKVHANGGAMGPQIWHVGQMPYGWDPPAPFEHPDSMSLEDIAQTIAAFGRAAAEAKALGFDCVEIHGAHGYLIDQFFWEQTNHRTDSYGGKTIRARSRFAVDIVKEIRKAVGEELAIIIRLSQWKQQDYTAKLANTPAEMEQWLLPLAEAGVDIFHCSQRRFWDAEFEGEDLNFAGWAKRITGKPTITVGAVGLSGDSSQTFSGKDLGASSLSELQRRFDRGDFDLVAVGRALLGDPEWVSKIKNGRTQELEGFKPAQLQVYY